MFEPISIRSTVLGIIAEELCVHAADIDGDKLLSHYGADDLDFIEIVMEIENSLLIEIDDKALAEEHTAINDLIAHVEKATAA